MQVYGTNDPNVVSAYSPLASLINYSATLADGNQQLYESPNLPILETRGEEGVEP